jgi:hypothetical protein
MGYKTLAERVLDIECMLVPIEAKVLGLVDKAARWDMHVDKKEALISKMENVRRRKRAKVKRAERDKEAAAIQDKCDRENMQVEMEEDKNKRLKQLRGC